MSVVAMIASMGTDVVLRRRAEDGTTTDRPARCLMHNDKHKATFAVDSAVDEGDEIVLQLPGGREKVHHVVEVRHQLGSIAAAHSATALWTTTKPQPDRTLASRSTKPFTLGALHPDVQAASAVLFEDGHHAQAVFEAVKAVEVRVRELSGLEGQGTSLMSTVFGAAAHLNMSVLPGQSGKDEREGFKLLFMGAMLALKNPRSHGLVQQDGQSALEALAFLSLLMRRLDMATTVR